jgi:hypothetical protein
MHRQDNAKTMQKPCTDHAKNHALIMQKPCVDHAKNHVSNWISYV